MARGSLYAVSSVGHFHRRLHVGGGDARQAGIADDERPAHAPPVACQVHRILQNWVGILQYCYLYLLPRYLEAVNTPAHRRPPGATYPAGLQKQTGAITQC